MGHFVRMSSVSKPVCITGCCWSIKLASTYSTSPGKWNSVWRTDANVCQSHWLKSTFCPNLKPMARHGCDEESRRASHSLSAHFALHPRYRADSFWTCAFCVVLQSKRVRPPVRTMPSQLQITVRAKRHQNMYGSKSDHFLVHGSVVISFERNQ